MPRVVRPMKQDADGGPLVGSQSKELGVRVPPNPHADIDVDGGGMVILNDKGMSVGANLAELPKHLIPKRLKDKYPGATGSNQLACYTMGRGLFAKGNLTSSLTLVLKKSKPARGNVAPQFPMSIDAFQQALADTRDQWMKYEH